MLQNKSLTDLRGLAQAHGVQDILRKSKNELVQAIEIKLQGLQPAPKVEIPKPEYDPRVMTKIPARLSEQSYIEKLLAPYVERGLKLTFPEPEVWHMRLDKREDTGTMRMPPRHILSCVRKIFE